MAFSFESDSLEDSPSKGKGGGATEESFGFSGVVFSKGLNVEVVGRSRVGGIESFERRTDFIFRLIGGAGGSSPKGLNAGAVEEEPGSVELNLFERVPISFSG